MTKFLINDISNGCVNQICTCDFYLLLIGKYNGLGPVEFLDALTNDYGPIIKLPGILNRNEALLLTDPNDFELAFRAEGSYPHRVLIKVFEYYCNQVCPKKYNFGGGLVTQHGEDWYKLRSIVNPIVVSPSMVRSHTPKADQISIDFIERIRKVRESNNETPANFMTEINKWAAEQIANIAFDTRLNLFKSENADTQDRGVKFVNTIHECVQLSALLEFTISPWEYFSTPAYKKFEKAVDTLVEYVNKFKR